MKKNAFIVFFLVLSSWLHAQEIVTICGSDYPFSVKNANVGSDLIARLEWDLTTAPNAGDLVIEIVPIKDCSNGILGTRFNETISIKIDANNIKSSKDVSVKAMWVKCFKWRLLSNSQNCTEATPWGYYSFLDQR